jgi:hypothetical protein
VYIRKTKGSGVGLSCRLTGMRVWVVVPVVCFLLVSCQRSYDHPPREVVVRECGREFTLPAPSSGDFRRAVRLDCGFLAPRHERTEARTIGL